MSGCRRRLVLQRRRHIRERVKTSLTTDCDQNSLFSSIVSDDP